MTSEEIVQRVQAAGVVGAGGAGFPTHVKLAAKNVDTIIANGAECEPMLRCDQQLMAAHPELVIRGMRLVMQAVGANRGLIAVKEHYAEAVAALQAELDRQKDSEDARAWPVSLYLIEKSVYPAGDEFCLVYEVTGRLIPEAGLPLNVGCVVQNVGTLANIAQAVDRGTPVTHRYVTVNGEVKSPRTVNAPLGMSFDKVIELAGGYTLDDSELKVVVGGPMTGHIVTDLKATQSQTRPGVSWCFRPTTRSSGSCRAHLICGRSVARPAVTSAVIAPFSVPGTCWGMISALMRSCAQGHTVSMSRTAF